MTLPERHILSKSTFVKGCQCEKALYLYKHRPDLKEPVSVQKQAVFDRGTDIGKLAQRLFPGGVDASPEHAYEYHKSVTLTKQFIDEGKEVIYEAAFQHDGVLAAIDVLVKTDGMWRGYEVKSSTSIYDTQILDAALQYHVITNSRIALDDIAIVHINNQYIRQGELDIQALFTIASIKEEVLERQAFITGQIPRLKEILAISTVPAIPIGEHCNTPYSCDFINHCWQHVPSPSVFDIANLQKKKQFELFNQGIIRFEDITDDVPLNKHQWLQVRCHLTNTEHVETPPLLQFLDTLTYPMYFLDFETFNPGIPLYDGTRPYQQVPFQFSIHYKKTREGELRHTAFLAPPAGDPCQAFIETLLAKTSMPGMILTYNQSFEIGILSDLAKRYPSYAERLQERVARIRDLKVPFQQCLYYMPAMQGSYSLKAVLPALVPELTYDQLPINNGKDASNAYEHMTVHPDVNHVKLRQDMLAYCSLDTMGMVRILEKLETVKQ